MTCKYMTEVKVRSKVFSTKVKNIIEYFTSAILFNEEEDNDVGSLSFGYDDDDKYESNQDDEENELNDDMRSKVLPLWYHRMVRFHTLPLLMLIFSVQSLLSLSFQRMKRMIKSAFLLKSCSKH